MKNTAFVPLIGILFRNYIGSPRIINSRLEHVRVAVVLRGKSNMQTFLTFSRLIERNWRDLIFPAIYFTKLVKV